MNDYIEVNRLHWDEAVPVHLASGFYEVDSFRAGKTTLRPLERGEVGDVRGKTLLHLQCHFGLDTLSWAREGAVVTGVDFSGAAIEQARALASEAAISARFLQSELYALPDVLHETFDVVFTSYGVLGWLDDVARWARVAAHFVKPGGVFYIAELHPIAQTLDDTPGTTEPRLRYPYFEGPAIVTTEDGTYADRNARLAHSTTYNFQHGLGEIVTSLIEAGLRLEFLHEHPFTVCDIAGLTQKSDDGHYRLTQGEGTLPLLFSLRATKPA